MTMMRRLIGRLEEEAKLDFPPDWSDEAIKVKLSEPEANVLLFKYSTGDFGKHKWSTVKSLINKGMLEEVGKNLVVTKRGKAWCLAHHMEYQFLKGYKFEAMTEGFDFDSAEMQQLYKWDEQAKAKAVRLYQALEDLAGKITTARVKFGPSSREYERLIEMRTNLETEYEKILEKYRK